MPAVRIVVDERERNSGIADLLKKAGAIVDIAQLPVGDYIVSPETAVERKTVHDLVHSIYDGRLFVQCSELVKYYAKPLVIIQGDLAKLQEIPDDVDASKVQKLKERMPLAYDALATVAMEFRDRKFLDDTCQQEPAGRQGHGSAFEKDPQGKPRFSATAVGAVVCAGSGGQACGKDA